MFADANTEAIRAFLPDFLEPVGPTIELFFMDTADAGSMPPYRAAGVVVPCSYGKITGSHILCEYVTSDVALAMAREVWGYPKKLAEIEFSETSTGVTSSVNRGGVTLMELFFTFGGPEPQRFSAMPRIQHKVIPRADGSGPDIDQIVTNEVALQDTCVSRPGTAQVRLQSAPQDPLARLAPLTVSGSEFVVADFNVGYCTVLEDRLRRSPVT